MYVLGLSGLDRSVSFRAKRFPDLRRQELRIGQGFDAAAALLGPQGIIAASAEERFTGVKGTERFPIQAVRSVLDAARVSLEGIDVIAHGFDYERYREHFQDSAASREPFDHVYSRAAMFEVLKEQLGPGPWAEKLVQVPHHLAHAASAYYPSGLENALVFVSDGMGEIESASVAMGSAEGIEPIASVSHRHSLGVLYGLFTLYLGFRFNSGEYKVMGLAPYGDPRADFDKLSSLVRLQDDGFYSIPVLQINESEIDRLTYRGSLRAIAEIFGPPRAPDEELTQRHMDIAAALQSVLQNATMHTLRTFKQRTGARSLCMAGGVALNCTSNGVIQRSRLFRDVFVQPASGDDGVSLGAALYVQQQREPKRARRAMSMPFWGHEETPEAIAQALTATDLRVQRFEHEASLTQAAAERLAGGQILGWFQGKMEFGPRALGNRSILADPRSATMRSRVNALVKKREDFRPFAPAVLAERATEYFDLRDNDLEAYAHMLFVTSVRPERRAELPAITHCDGSARVQTVFEDRSPLFYRLISAFERQTGLPILLNTSFNVRGQPIVRTAEEAVQTFREARLDALVIGMHLVTLDG